MPPMIWPSSVFGLTIVPGVVDRRVAQERHLARLDVDLDDGDVPGVADERVEDPEVGAIVVRQRRQRVVVGRLRREPAAPCRAGRSSRNM